MNEFEENKQSYVLCSALYRNKILPTLKKVQGEILNNNNQISDRNQDSFLDSSIGGSRQSKRNLTMDSPPTSASKCWMNVNLLKKSA